MNRSEVLDTAKLAIIKDRDATHGNAENSFAKIGALWGEVLGHEVTPHQVALMMVLLKVSRAWGNPAHGDNWVDIAGYAACGAEVAA